MTKPCCIQSDSIIASNEAKSDVNDCAKLLNNLKVLNNEEKLKEKRAKNIIILNLSISNYEHEHIDSIFKYLFKK